MLLHQLITATLMSMALASKNSSTFYPPKSEPFLSIDFRVGWPVNVTTPNAVISVIPTAGDAVRGQINGTILANTTGGFETSLRSSSKVSEFTDYKNQFVFVDTSDNYYLISMAGIAQYAHLDIHGFAHVVLQTGAPGFEWVNYAMFVGEWNGPMDSGTGLARLDIFKVISGGRRDRKCIKALSESKST